MNEKEPDIQNDTEAIASKLSDRDIKKRNNARGWLFVGVGFAIFSIIQFIISANSSSFSGILNWILGIGSIVISLLALALSLPGFLTTSKSYIASKNSGHPKVGMASGIIILLLSAMLLGSVVLYISIKMSYTGGFANEILGVEVLFIPLITITGMTLLYKGIHIIMKNKDQNQNSDLHQ